MNWAMIQALATCSLVLLAVVDSIVYYGWHAKHERQTNSVPMKCGNVLNDAGMIGRLECTRKHGHRGDHHDERVGFRWFNEKENM